MKTDHTADKTSIEQELVDLQKIDPELTTTVFILFSGHGHLQDEKTKHDDKIKGERRNQKYYFLPSKTQFLDEKNKRVKEDTVLSSQEIWRYIEKIPADNVAVLFNTCYAGAAGTNLCLEDRISLSTKKHPRSSRKHQVIIFSSAEAENSYILPDAPYSIFGSKLLEALTERKIVGILEVYLYLEGNIQPKRTDMTTSTNMARAVNFPIALMPEPEPDIRTALEKIYGLQDCLHPIEWTLPDLHIPESITLDDLITPLVEDDPGSYGHQLAERRRWGDITWIKTQLKEFFTGQRGLFNHCLADALLTVPPLKRVFDILWKSLNDHHKVGIFAHSGTGKSMKLLYLAAYWKKKHSEGDIVLCSDPKSLNSEQRRRRLRQFLNVRSRPLLLIFDDLHHAPIEIHNLLQNLMDDRKITHTSWLGGFTISSVSSHIKDIQNAWMADKDGQKLMKFEEEWHHWKTFFKDWIEWVRDEIGVGRSDLHVLDWKGVNSPWEAVVIVGGFTRKIDEYFERQKKYYGSDIEKTIYWLLAVLFLLYKESPVPLDEFINVLRQGDQNFQDLLTDYFLRSKEGKRWEEGLEILFQDWETPKGEDLRLLPKRPQRLSEDPRKKIDFLHQRLATMLWNKSEKEFLYDLLDKAYKLNGGLKAGIDCLKKLGKSLETIFQRFSIGKESKKHLSIYLRSLKFENVPEWIQCFSQLKEIDLSSNLLPSLPDWFFQLTGLQTLNLGRNKFTSLPETIEDLKNLQILNLCRNKLTFLPETLGNLANLKELRLWGNKLTFLPASIGNLKNLKMLYLYANKLTSLPETLGNLANLKELDLWSNKLVSLPAASIENLTQLVELNLWDNKLVSLPAGLLQLPNFKKLTVDSQLRNDQIVQELQAKGVDVSWI
ncbi:MAG: leucine-rich repeat domain-containing protein [Candidatus Hodarchaeota archaeon]